MVKDISEYKFIEKLKALEFVEEIWLFGSRARGDNIERSDFDLAIVCPRATDVDWLHILAIVDDADTLIKVDCVRLDKNRISESLYNNIICGRKEVYVKK